MLGKTDLALELNESIDKSDSRYSGIMVTEKTDTVSNIKVTVLDILNENGEKLFGKPRGSYITLESEPLNSNDDDYNQRLIELLSEQIFKLIKPCIENNRNILVVGLGNRELTADSLGPCVTSKLIINRHLYYDAKTNLKISSLIPGVMSQTGMETAEIIKGIVKTTKPGVVVAIDALAARSVRRLNSTVQLSNRGINPGSGVGNHREGITFDTMGVPVIAIGVPTVIDAATIISDYVEDAKDIPYELKNMFVTPKDVDSCIEMISYVVAEALNKLVYTI